MSAEQDMKFARVIRNLAELRATVFYGAGLLSQAIDLVKRASLEYEKGG